MDIFSGITRAKMEEIISETKKKFRESIVDRGAKRIKNVTKYREDLWEVEGDAELGDSGKSYYVSFNESELKYYCDCYNSIHGEIREASICSHVLAVILYRKLERVGKITRKYPKVVSKGHQSEA